MFVSATALAVVVGLVFLVGMVVGRAVTIELAKRAEARRKARDRKARQRRAMLRQTQ